MLSVGAERDGGDIEDSDVSEMDPDEILKNLKGLDDMDAELFATMKKPSSAPKQTKPAGDEGSKKDFSALDSNIKPDGADQSTTRRKKPDSTPSSTGRTSKKFTFSDLDDPLDDLFPSESKPKPKPTSQQAHRENSEPSHSPSLSPVIKRDTVTKPEEHAFNKKLTKKENVLWSNTERRGPPQRVRTALDEILERGTSPRLLERPPTGKRQDPPQSQESQRQDEPPSVKALEDDLVFGSYKPTFGSAGEGRLSRRPSVRFSAEDVSVAPAAKMGTDTSSPAIKPEVSTNQNKEEGDDDDVDDWLAGALRKKKALFVSNSEDKQSKKEESLGSGEQLDLESLLSEQVTSPAARSRNGTLTTVKESDIRLGHTSSAIGSASVTEEKTKQAVPHRNQNLMPRPSSAVQQQVPLTPDSLQQLLLQQQVLQSQMLGRSDAVDAGVLQRLKEKDQQSADIQVLQARIVQLEGQVKTLQLERDLSQMLVETVQQRHKEDMELMENAHRARVKLLEESAAQREKQSQQEYEDLMECLATLRRSAEQERSELQGQYQRKISQAQQDRDREVERLRDLQRKAILEMKEDHEDHVQRLKRLKDEEIDALTSATSQTRSLTAVIEQMEKFSSRLGELSSRVESTHEHTTQGLEHRTQHRDKQLQIMQDRLNQQQKSMLEEKAYLKEIIARMDTQLTEQQRQLEKERWKMTAEQAKAESTLRTLEEERRVLNLQISLEREELEKAKNALVEEQKAVMQRCAEERRRLAAERNQFHDQEKQRRDRADQEAQEQSELKLRAAEIKQKEITLTQERDALKRLREELDTEKERISDTALRLKTRVQEVEAFSKLAAEKYEEGEQALQEAKRVEAEHQRRLRNVHSQTENLRQQQQQILQEQIRLSHLKKGAESLRPDIPMTSLPQIPPGLPDSVDSGLSSSKLTSSSFIAPPTSFSSCESTELEASLALWKYNASKDGDYLQQEQIYLNKLKSKSHRTK
ncbi:fas-binding factor 1 homolog isoform X2 [Thalassophryne amazonica]|uniref:fas-binding factor 1 homolog isoform X2 n=1 Tax=Thalassophryne amazonica TaxID=390379 RepID=UPI001471C7A9|nr:fas-binding factor 1 homolog isoform X2 [Thalassophryne amazonica]